MLPGRLTAKTLKRTSRSRRSAGKTMLEFASYPGRSISESSEAGESAFRGLGGAGSVTL